MPAPSAISSPQARLIAAVLRRVADGGPTAPPRMVSAPSVYMPVRGLVSVTRCPSHMRVAWVNPESAICGMRTRATRGSGEGGLKLTRSLVSSASRTEPPVSQRPNSAGAGDWEGCDPVAWLPDFLP